MKSDSSKPDVKNIQTSETTVLLLMDMLIYNKYGYHLIQNCTISLCPSTSIFLLSWLRVSHGKYYQRPDRPTEKWSGVIYWSPLRHDYSVNCIIN